MPITIAAYIGIIMWSILILYLFIKNCIIVDEIAKYNFNKKKMYKYKSWMFFIFRYRWNTSGNRSIRKYENVDENNMEYISIISFWLQVFFILLFIAIIVIMGILNASISKKEYGRILQILLYAEIGAVGVFWFSVFICAFIAEGKAEKRYKANEMQNNEILGQSVETKEFIAPIEETILNQNSSTDSDTDNYNPYIR